MTPKKFRISWEHNHGLPPPALTAFCGLVATLALYQLDPWFHRLITADGARPSVPLGGDIRRELEALQQFGQGGMTILVALAIWLLDPPNRRRLLDWLAAIAIAAVFAYGGKMLIGRPRPSLDEPQLILGPFGLYPLPTDGGPVMTHAWNLLTDGVSRLHSMPSSHTVYAVVAAAMLSAWYPRLKPLMIAMAALVALARVVFGAHYPADVAAGAAVGLIAANLALRWRPSGLP